MVIGASPRALSAAACRVIDLGGGLAVVDGAGAVRAELALPLGGVASLGSVAEVAGGLEAVEHATRALGCRLSHPLLTLQTLTFTAIPVLRLTTRGLLRVKSQEYVAPLL